MDRTESNINNFGLIRMTDQLHSDQSMEHNVIIDKKCTGIVITESLLNFVDLAGSEKVSNHFQNISDNSELECTIKQRIQEGKHINSSLFFLTLVIQLKS